MVSNESCNAYSPVLTTYYLRGEIPESALYFCDIGYYRGNDISCHFGTAVVGLNAAAQRVTLDDGTQLDYDKLLIATGASAKRIAELDPEIAAEVLYLRTVADARRIREATLGAKNVVMMGGGLVSLQVAGAVARPDLRVTCVVTSRRILSQNIDATCAALVCDHVERRRTSRSCSAPPSSRSPGREQGIASASTPVRNSRPTCSLPERESARTSSFVDRTQIAVDRASWWTTTCAPRRERLGRRRPRPGPQPREREGRAGRQLDRRLRAGRRGRRRHGRRTPVFPGRWPRTSPRCSGSRWPPSA